MLNDEDLGSVPEDVAASWWAGMQAAPVRRPSPGAGYDLRIDTGEVIGSGLYWNHSLAHLSCFPGAGPGTPSERPGPPACPGGQRSRNLRR